jgi:hypothetical protein
MQTLSLFRATRGTVGSLLLTSVGVAGCSGGPSDAALEQEAPPTVIDARVIVSRSGDGEASTAQAMAHFARSSGDKLETLAAAGLVDLVPEGGTCQKPSSFSGTSFASVEEVLLLDVGEVTLSPALGADDPISLAPHAFPSVSGFVSGVVYTSRGRSAEALPSGVAYRVAISGGADLPGFQIHGAAPNDLTDVTLGGEPLSRVLQLSTSEPLDVTWNVNSSVTDSHQPTGLHDLVLVDLADGEDGSVFVRCAFADEVGSGTIPRESVSELSGSGRVIIHRHRVMQSTLSTLARSALSHPSLPHPSPLQGLDDASTLNGSIRLSFDLETSVSVDFVE